MSGVNRQTRLGKINFTIILPTVIWPPIQSIVVVTSPMGDHAPPALAAITIMPAKNSLSWGSFMIFRRRDTITMVVVRLSSIADKKKVTMEMIHNRFRLLVFVIFLVMILNPL